MLQIDGYDLDREVNQGGTSVLYRAVDPDTDETVAVKVLHDHLKEKSDRVKEFRSEARMLSKLDVEQVPDLFDTGTANDRPYMVLEYVEGENLRKRLRSGLEFVQNHWMTIGIRAAKGLSGLHVNNIIHKDVKPENILVGTDLTVRLIDLSIATENGLFSYLFGSGNVQGTPKYMSPEQINGERLGYTSDVYSLGICLYEMATGDPPFQGHTEQQVLDRNRHSDPRHPHLKNSAIPVDLSRFLMTMLEKDPDDRIPDMNLVIHNLKKHRETFLQRQTGAPRPLERVREEGDPSTKLVPPNSYVTCEKRESREEDYQRPEGDQHALLNVSRSGIGFLSTRPFEQDEILDLLLVVPSTGDRIRFRGEVRWCVREDEKEMYSVAVKLLLRDPDYLERFDEWKNTGDVEMDV